MSETFVNVYPAGKSVPHESAAEAQRWANFGPDFTRVQKMYLGTWWHRPPVGMRAGEASHEWRTDYGRCQCAKPLPYLEPRK